MTNAKGPIRVDPALGRAHPGADPLATEVVINLVRTDSLVSAELARLLRRHGLSTATFNVLMILDGAGAPLCPFEIGDRLLVTRGTVTGLLDSLEQRGLIRRAAHPDDRRMLQIALTPKGKGLLKRLLPEHFPKEAAMMSVLSDREKQTLVRLLGKLQDHLTG